MFIKTILVLYVFTPHNGELWIGLYNVNHRDERVHHYLYLYLYLLTIWIICICICTRTGRGLARKWAGFNLELGRVVLKWAGL